MKLLLFQLTLFGALRWMYYYGKISFLCLTFENIVSILFHFFRLFARISFKGPFVTLFDCLILVPNFGSFFGPCALRGSCWKFNPFSSDFYSLKIWSGLPTFFLHFWMIWIGYRVELMTLVNIFYRTFHKSIFVIEYWLDTALWRILIKS